MKFKILRPQVIHERPDGRAPHSAVSPTHPEAGEKDRFFLVCGGSERGEQSDVAAATVCAAMERCVRLNADPQLVFAENELNVLFQAARDQLDARLSSRNKQAATSLALLCLHRGGALMAHIGDCRLYHVRPSKNALLYRSADDAITAPDGTRQLTKALQPHESAPCPPTVVRSTDVRPGDRFLVCSHNVAAAVGDDELLKCIGNAAIDLKNVRYRLQERLDADCPECAALLVEIADMTLETADAGQPDEEAALACRPTATPVPPARKMPKPTDAYTPTPNQQRRLARTDEKSKVRKKTHPGLRAVRNWTLSLLGIGFVCYAAYYVFSGKAAPDPETVEMPTDTTRTDSAATDTRPIDWLGGGTDTPGGDADTKKEEKETERKPTAHPEEESATTEEDLMESPSLETEPAEKHPAEETAPPASPATPPAEKTKADPAERTVGNSESTE